jgi:hypothetical protein
VTYRAKHYKILDLTLLLESGERTFYPTTFSLRASYLVTFRFHVKLRVGVGVRVGLRVRVKVRVRARVAVRIREVKCRGVKYHGIKSQKNTEAVRCNVN